MDGGAVSATIEVLVQNLINVSKEEISLIRGLQKNADKLSETLGMMQSFMDDAQNKFITETSVRRWLKQLEAASFDADNVLDELNYQFLSRKMKKSIQAAEKKKIPSCSPSFSHYARRRQTALRVKDINMTFECINNEANKLGLERRLAEAPVVAYDHAFETNSFSHDPIFIGRDNDVSEIVKMLTTCQTEQVLSVLPILGMGGLGKTTLTRNVFHHQNIKTHFGERIWVHVGKIFDPVSLLKKVLSNLKPHEKVDGEASEAILKKLQEVLGEKTYLLVLDDVWNEDQPRWEDFKNSISGISSKKGNTIIVTTRSTKVASIVKFTHPIYELQGLPDDNCWSIIKRKAFGGGDVPRGYETIGKDIAGRCQGLPLAANVVGSVLDGKSEEEWRSIKENWLSDVEEQENNITKILKLSYLHLSSPSLKRCFAYCSIFKKGKEIDKDELIELWMAEGFLQPYDRSNMETEGKKFLNLLLQNSLLQVAKKDDYDNITHYSMHDLVHDLAYKVLGSKYYGHESGAVSKEKAKYLRTLFYQGDISHIIFSDFKSLHVLNLSGRYVKELPSSIKEIKHLRYLNVTDTYIDSLPDWIGQLYHLQTLRAHRLELPSTLKYLVNLRHLHVHNGTELPAELGMLTYLQTLEQFKVGEEKGRRIVELGSLHKLKGKLTIHNLEKVDGEGEAKKACLFMKPNIIKLGLRWDESREGEITRNDENVLEGLQPHPNLKMLEIFGFKGASFPSWTLKMAVRDEANGQGVGLNNLVEIKLSSCSECEEIPKMGHLPHRRALLLSGMRNLKSIGTSFYGIDNLCSSSNRVGEETIIVFPALKRIEFLDMRELIEWVKLEIPSAAESREVKVFPSLECLKITKCPKLVSAPVYEFPCLEELVIDECDELLCLPTLSFHINQNLSKLYIKKCPKLRELPNSLQALTSLEKLKIEECPYLEYLDTSLPLAHTSGIILRSLTKIKISGLEGLVSLPNWLFTNSPNLTQLAIKNCHKLRELPDGLHTLTSLEDLTIEACQNLKELDAGLPFADTCAPKLTSLTWISIWSLEGLVCLPNWLFSNSPNLRVLWINGCPKLRELPDGLHTLTSLKEMSIHWCRNIESIPYDSSSGQGGLKSLRDLSIHGCKSLVSFPCEILESCSPSLEELSLEYLDSLINLPTIIDSLHKIPHLRILTIMRVPKLIMSSSCTLPSLQRLMLGVADSDSWESFNSAVGRILQGTSESSLKRVYLNGMKDWDSLPDQIQHLAALEDLTIFDFGIQELPEWFVNFTSLRELSLSFCKKLRRLPPAEVFSRLIKLEINKCPLLKESCGIEQVSSGRHHSEWPNISHIPNIKVDFRQIRSDGQTVERFRYLDEAAAED